MPRLQKIPGNIKIWNMIGPNALTSKSREFNGCTEGWLFSLSIFKCGITQCFEICLSIKDSIFIDLIFIRCAFLYGII